MCGIVGYIDFKRSTQDSTIEDMMSSLHHRGPDDQGFKFFKEPDYLGALGHTRLSIIDLSEGGHQPMQFKHLSIVFNGEIYNYKEIRKELENKGYVFTSESDTEVVLQAFFHWGYDCVSKFIGMFAFAIYNELSHELIFCRDRAGVKPLYYYWNNGLLLFASELKAFHQHPSFVSEVSFDAAYYYMQYSYVPAPLSIYENCFKVEQGYWLTFNLSKREFRKEQYWSLSNSFALPLLNISYDEAKDELEKLLISSCKYRMVADVPVGIFLSGGYDSSGITGILQASQSNRIKTFTIGFPEGVDEAPFAKEIADHLGTDHSEFYCSIDEAKKVIPELPQYYDEPFADISGIPTILVSRLAKKSVTVALSGDGGDELFAGYGGFPYYFKLKKFEDFPRLASKSLSHLLSFLADISPGINPFHRHKMKGFFTAMSMVNPYNIQTLADNKRSLPHAIITKMFNRDRFPEVKGWPDNILKRINDPYAVLLLMDYVTSLPDQLLVKTDRATMSASLEGREPLLDHRLAEFAARLPLTFKINGGRRKIIFKDVVHKYVDPKLLDRPKTGFDLPLFDWLRGDLSFLLEEYLSPERIKSTGIFDADFVSSIVTRFKENKIHYNNIIWRLIQFQMWHQAWKEKSH